MIITWLDDIMMPFGDISLKMKNKTIFKDFWKQNKISNKYNKLIDCFILIFLFQLKFEMQQFYSISFQLTSNFIFSEN